MDKKLIEFLQENDLELQQNGQGYTVVSAKPVRPTVKQLLRQFLNNAPVEFKQAPKQATVMGLKALIRKLADEHQCGFSVLYKEPKPRQLEMALTCLSGKEDCDEVDVYSIWGDICELLAKDGYYESWKIGDMIYDKSVANELAARAARQSKDVPISAEDVKDVSILVNAYPTVDEFLRHI